MRVLILISAFILSMLMGTAYAQQTIKAGETGGVEDTTLDKVKGAADTAEGATTSWMRDVVSKFDSLFVDDDYSTFGENKTRLRLRLEAGYAEHHGWDTKSKIKLHLVLPVLSKRARLVMNDEDDEVASSSPVAAETDARESDVAFRWLLRQSDNIDFSFDLGLRTKSGNLDPFVRFNTRFRYDLGKTWYGKTANRLYYYNETQWRIDFRQSFNRPITEDVLFRARTRVQYFDENDYNPFLEQKFSVFHTLNPKTALAYEALWQKQAEEDIVYDQDERKDKWQDNYQNVQLRVRLRQNVWRPWLYVEVWPIVGWAEARDWDTVFGAFFRFEITFGGKGDSRLGG
jgi:hypothetical protein